MFPKNRNYDLLYFSLFRELIFVNELIEQIFAYHKQFLEASNKIKELFTNPLNDYVGRSSCFLQAYQFLTEHLIYRLNKFIELYDEDNNKQDLCKCIRDCINSYKHQVLGIEKANAIGQNEPSIIAVYDNYNNAFKYKKGEINKFNFNKRDIKFWNTSLNQIILRFNDILGFIAQNKTSHNHKVLSF